MLFKTPAKLCRGLCKICKKKREQRNIINLKMCQKDKGCQESGSLLGCHNANCENMFQLGKYINVCSSTNVQKLDVLQLKNNIPAGADYATIF
jgi:hypothetical protein